MHKKLIFTLSILIILGVCIGSIRYVYFSFIAYPPEPVTSGDFPIQPVWVYEADKRIISTPVVSNGKIFIRTIDSVCIVNPQNGKESHCINSPNGFELSIAPLVDENNIYVPEKYYFDISAYSIDTGERLWRSLPTNNQGISQITPIEDWVLEKAKLFVVRVNQCLTAYDIGTGALVWSTPVHSRIGLRLAASSNTIYLTEDKQLNAFESVMGKKLWQLAYKQTINSILLDDQILYLAFYHGPLSLVALDVNTLEIKWQAGYLEAQDNDFTSIAIEGDRVYLCGNRMIAIDKQTGEALWVSGELGWLEQPVVLDGRIYVRNIKTMLYSLDAETGKETGRLLVQENSTDRYDQDRSPIIFGDLLIVPFGDNRLFAYRP